MTRLGETIEAAHAYVADTRSEPPRPHDLAVAVVELCNERAALRALLEETLKPGAYGIGSTLAHRISVALGRDIARPRPTINQACAWPFPAAHGGNR